MKKVKVKVLVAGAPACGKSCLIQMYVSNGSNFLKDYNMTQGAEVSSKIIPFDDKDKDIELFFFDLGGQDIYDSIIKELIPNADLAIYVFDCTNQESFQAIPAWHDKIKKANNNKNIPSVIVSTKNDLKTAKTIDISEGKNLAQKIGAEYFEVSAARSMDLDAPFNYLAQQALQIKPTLK